jgi:DNA mismatch repair protein MutS
MAFIADKQTLEDLNLTGKFRSGSIFSLFNKTRTAGGERLLEQYFRAPMTDVAAINARSAKFKSYQEQPLAQALVFPIDAAVFRTAENYLSSGGPGNYPATLALWSRRKAAAALLKDEQYEVLQSGLQAAIQLLRDLKTFQHIPVISKVLSDPRLKPLFEHTSLSLMQCAHFDHLLRHTLRDAIEQLLEAAYELDVCISVAATANELKLSYAVALSEKGNIIDISGLRHPALPNAISNDLKLDSNTNLLFLTGANMAGKSTLMKSFGIATYLAHMGFPVPATTMQFTIKDGLYSSINVADNLQQGYSHFYAEVLRVKTIATAVASDLNLVVIFDELFKGTNVKDAYDATLAVTSAFAKYRNCVFIISTHITEVGEALQQTPGSLRFDYLPTVMEGPTPRYTYQLKPGITEDRHGMKIILNERIVEILQ